MCADSTTPGIARAIVRNSAAVIMFLLALASAANATAQWLNQVRLRLKTCGTPIDQGLFAFATSTANA
jgi:hypothetical protein